MDPVLIQQLLPIALTHLVAFLVFIWLLNKFAVKPVLRLLDERRDRIANQFDQIAASEKRVAALREEYEQKIQDINEEARKRVAEEVNKGKRTADEIAEKARAEASEIVDKAKANIQVQVDKARTELKEEIVNMAISAAERLLREQLDEQKHRELVGSFIQEMESKS
ncbi:MAG: F0F1 ATP synthase subunit B [Candidatus Sumerlaeia bacterium]